MNESSDKPSIEAEIDAFRDKYRLVAEYFQNLKTEQRWHTQNDVCFTHEGMTVREFHGLSDNRSTPVLIVYSHVNLPYVIDLNKQHSLVCRLLETGHKVFLIDWGEVNSEARTRDLSVYLHDYLDNAIDCITDRCGTGKINLVGICQGGTFCLCYASIHPEKIRSLVTMVAPVDFHAGESVIWKWARKVDFSVLEKTPVNIPGSMITLFFQSLRPFDEMMRSIQLIQNSDLLENLGFTALVDQWVLECPDQPGKAFAQFMRQFYQENKLVRDGLELDGHRINLSNVRCPVLNLYAAADHLVPPDSACALRNHIPKEKYSEVKYDGGHIGLMVGSRAHQTILPRMAVWLASSNHR